MIDLLTLKRKKEFITSLGEKIIDFTKASLKFKFSPSIKAAVIVSEDLVMRPDLIAKIQYGDSNKLDYILKFNAISNPFSIDAGQLLLIPDDDEMAQQFINPTVQQVLNGGEAPVQNTNKLFDTTKLGKKDQKRLEYMQAKAEQNGNTQLLTPNLAGPGDKEIKVKDGKIVFGDDVAGSAENCPEPFSRAKVKQKLIQQKIFKK